MPQHEARRTVVDYGAHTRSALNRTLEREIIPRLVRTHRPAVRLSEGALAPSSIPVETCARFFEALLAPSEAEATALVAQLVHEGRPADALMLELLAPAAVLAGERWAADTCDFVQVTVLVGRLQRMMRDLGQRLTATGTPYHAPGRALVSTLPGETHTFGLHMVAEFLYADGWGVLIGAPVESRAAADRVAEEWIDIAAFSVSRTESLLPLRQEIAEVRRRSLNPRVKVMVGGHAVHGHPDAVKLTGADAGAVDARDAVRVARHLIADAVRVP